MNKVWEILDKMASSIASFIDFTIILVLSIVLYTLQFAIPAAVIVFSIWVIVKLLHGH